MTDAEVKAAALATLSASGRRVMRRDVQNFLDTKGLRFSNVLGLTGEDEDPLRRVLCALLMMEGGREVLETCIRRSTDSILDTEELGVFDEVVVGAGVHAAIWCANRDVQPFVMDQSPDVGGTFATKRPVFYLNSRNRRDVPWAEPLPGRGGALNRMPGARIQPMDLSYSEYQPQTDLAFAAGLNLVLDAQVATGARVLTVRSEGGGRYVVEFQDPEDGQGNLRLLAGRVVLATGPGDPAQRIRRDGYNRTMDFPAFVSKMGAANKPLEGWGNVAVVGAGDSGSVVCEYLLGQGPEPPLSNAQRSMVERVTWIGQRRATCEAYRRAVRSRYQGLGRFMPRRDRPGDYVRLFPQPGTCLSAMKRGTEVEVRYEYPAGTIQSRMFDHVVLCDGFENNTSSILGGAREETVMLDGEPVAMKVRGEEIYRVGPCAALAVRDKERVATPALAQIPENSLALFRYADKTAKLARYITEMAKEVDVGYTIDQQAGNVAVEIPF